MPSDSVTTAEYCSTCDRRPSHEVAISIIEATTDTEEAGTMFVDGYRCHGGGVLIRVRTPRVRIPQPAFTSGHQPASDVRRTTELSGKRDTAVAEQDTTHAEGPWLDTWSFFRHGVNHVPSARGIATLRSRTVARRQTGVQPGNQT